MRNMHDFRDSDELNLLVSITVFSVGFVLLSYATPDFTQPWKNLIISLASTAMSLVSLFVGDKLKSD